MSRKDVFHGNRFCAGQACAASAPAPLWLSLLPAFLAYFFLDFSLRLFYGAMSNVSLWAWQPLVFTLLWSGTMTAIAALLPRTGRRIFLLVTFVPFVLLTITHCVLYQLTGTCFSFADLAYAGDGARFVSAAYFHLKVGQWLSIAVCLALMLCAVIFTPQTRVGPPRRDRGRCAGRACAAGIFVVHTTQMPGAASWSTMSILRGMMPRATTRLQMPMRNLPTPTAA